MKNNNKQNELAFILNQFLKMVFVDFGIRKSNDKIQKWYELSWDEFKKELEGQSVKINEYLINDWKEFFNNHKTKVQRLLKQKTVA